MLVCMTRNFSRLFKKANIDHEKMNAAIREICARNAIPLGHRIYKKRIGSRFGGKRGGFRSILYYRLGEVIVFIYLYAKNEQEDVTDRERRAFVELALAFDRMDTGALHKAIAENRLERWNHEE